MDDPKTESELPQSLPGDENYQSPHSDVEVEAFKAQAIGYDPMGGGDTCTCGGRIQTRHEKQAGGGAIMVQRCSTCGKDPASLD